MNKGFDYFSNKDCNAFFRQYLIVFLLFYIMAIIFSILAGNKIFMYISTAIIPYLIIKRYEYMHKPLLDIEQGIKKIDCEYYNTLLNQLSKTIGTHKIKNEQQRKNIFLSILGQDNKDNVDERILTYKKNVSKLYATISTTLFILFFTFFVLLFAYASMK